MPPYLGGFTITSLAWAGAHALQVRFTSTWGSAYQYQLYGGRTLIGVTDGTSQRSVVGQITPATWPEHITLLAVAPSQRLTDYGRQLPPRPFNRVRLHFTADGYPSDAKYLDVYAGSVPGGAATTRVGRLLCGGDGDYEFLTEPLAGSGLWNFAIQGVDDRPSAGNTGAALALSQRVVAHPPDVQFSSNTRLAVTVAGGIGTVSFVRP